MKYIYETHFHTADVSTCAHISAQEAVGLYKKAGYSGVVVTDHFSKECFEKNIPVRPGLRRLIIFSAVTETQKNWQMTRFPLCSGLNCGFLKVITIILYTVLMKSSFMNMKKLLL